MKDYKLLHWLLNFVSHVKGKVLLAVIFGIVSNLSVVAIPLIGVHEVLMIIKERAGQPMKALLLMVACGVVRGVTRYGEQYFNHDIAFHLLADIRQEIFATIRSLGPAKLIGKKSGDLVATITTDVETLEVFFAHTISPVLIATGTTIITAGYLWRYDVVLALILLLGQLIVGYRKSRALGDDYQIAFVEHNQNVMENTASLQDITQYSIEAEQLKKLDDTGKQLNRQYQRRLAQESMLKILSEIVLLTTVICIMVVGIQLKLSGATLLTGTVLSLSSFGSVLALSGLGSTLLTTLASGRRLFMFTTEQPDVDFSTSQKELSDFEKSVIDNVTFSYSDDQATILSDLSLSIEKGAVIGIGGRSGNGKSTLVKLVMCYWDPQFGKIMFDQTNIKAIQAESLHQIEGVMEQATFIFEDTVTNNIRLGKKQATQVEIETSAKQASLHEWILSLPEQYETKIGGNNRSISDGERQRVGLARLFIHDAPFLLLDELTSNLDYLNEQAILHSLTKGIEDKTVLVISHRDTTLEITDQRYELSDGKLSKL